MKKTCHQGVNLYPKDRGHLSRDLYEKLNVSNTNLIDGENIARKKKSAVLCVLHVYMHDG